MKLQANSCNSYQFIDRSRHWKTEYFSEAITNKMFKRFSYVNDHFYEAEWILNSEY